MRRQTIYKCTLPASCLSSRFCLMWRHRLRVYWALGQELIIVITSLMESMSLVLIFVTGAGILHTPTQPRGFPSSLQRWNGHIVILILIHINIHSPIHTHPSPSIPVPEKKGAKLLSKATPPSLMHRKNASQARVSHPIQIGRAHV